LPANLIITLLGFFFHAITAGTALTQLRVEGKTFFAFRAVSGTVGIGTGITNLRSINSAVTTGGTTTHVVGYVRLFAGATGVTVHVINEEIAFF
jgi:hypothetical protein